MIRKSVKRFSEKIMLQQQPRARWGSIVISSRSGPAGHRLLRRGGYICRHGQPKAQTPGKPRAL